MGKHRRDESSGTPDRGSNDSGPSSSASSSSSEDEREHKRERKDKDKKDKDKKHKKDKKKHKKEKSHKKHKERKKDRDKGDGDDARVKAAKEFLKQQLAGGAPAAPTATLLPASEAQKLPSSQQISDDDYFLKSNEFMAWLPEYKGKLFNELTTEDSRTLFSEFVGVWNSGRLAPKYYGGLVQAPIKRTTHQWSFKREGGAGVSKGMAAFLDDKKEMQGAARDQQRLDRKKRAGEERELLDELLPKATGRDAIAEKRIARREEAKARGASPDRAFLPGGGDMMGGDESFEAAKARESRRAETLRNRQLLKREEVSQKVAAAQAAEDEKMAQFRALLNQGPITIARRQ